MTCANQDFLLLVPHRLCMGSFPSTILTQVNAKEWNWWRKLCSKFNYAFIYSIEWKCIYSIKKFGKLKIDGKEFVLFRICLIWFCQLLVYPKEASPQVTEGFFVTNDFVTQIYINVYMYQIFFKESRGLNFLRGGVTPLMQP